MRRLQPSALDPSPTPCCSPASPLFSPVLISRPPILRRSCLHFSTRSLRAAAPALGPHPWHRIEEYDLLPNYTGGRARDTKLHQRVKPRPPPQGRTRKSSRGCRHQ